MTAYTLFISDLHLQETSTQINALFLNFLSEQAPNAQALYILGDLFDAWIGDDNQTRFHQSIQQALKTLSDKIPIFLMHGNRDFFIGKRFCRETGVTLLDDPSVITLYGQAVILSHGDHLCTLDSKHQRYRKIIRHPWVKHLLLQLPLATRRHIANYLRKKSQSNTISSDNRIMDVSPEAVYELFKQSKSHLLIHGHTHRPNIHKITELDAPTKRVVLGAWHPGNAQYLRFYETGELSLVNLYHKESPCQDE